MFLIVLFSTSIVLGFIFLSGVCKDFLGILPFPFDILDQNPNTTSWSPGRIVGGQRAFDDRSLVRGGNQPFPRRVSRLDSTSA